MEDQNKNLILAIVLSSLVILVWFVLFPPPEPTPRPETGETAETTGETVEPGIATVPTGADAEPGATGTVEASDDTADEFPRLPIETDRLIGTISLKGGRIDDLSLKDYRVTNDPESDIVQMLSAAGGPGAYYVLYGWAPGQGLAPEDVPGASTPWQVEQGETLGLNAPVVLIWENGKGLTFRRKISIDENYLFSIEQSVENKSQETVTLAPYGIIARHGEPEGLRNFFILHEGAISNVDGVRTEIDYDDFDSATEFTEEEVTKDGWIGFTDHYWMTMLAPRSGTAFKSSAFHDTRRDIFQTTAKLATETLAPGQSASATTDLFAGAKEWDTIRDYESAGILDFLDSIDWGWFFYLTKPIFWLLHHLNNLIGNMGWAIIGLTLIIKAALFPLAYKSYVSMAKMKELQPQMEKLKEQAGDDRQQLQKGMMELYKKEKVNPAAGCLPILLQIPIFFSLYKVIFVTIELRHAPWFGPFQDLSAADPTSIINLFGLLPFEGPVPGSFVALIFIGILPLLLGISMWLQQKLNPAPTDPTQQMIFAWMPWVFMFMLGSFASGLVVYWIANNTITFIQQYAIMRSQGYTPDVFGNIKSSFAKKAKSEKK